MKITREVYTEIINSLGNQMPEHGGILGADSSGLITTYYYDHSGRSAPDAYIPDVTSINRVLESWHTQGIHMIGIVHSHSPGIIAPSCGDISYGIQILQSLDTTDVFYLPILTQDVTDISLHGYALRQIGRKLRYQSEEIIMIQ